MADTDDLVETLGVIDAAALATDLERVRASIEAGETVLAVRCEPGDDERTAEGPILGALVLDGPVIEAIAVRRRRRGQGIGTALVAAVAATHARLVATFDPSVRPFYAALGFAIETVDDRNRCRGTWFASSGSETGYPLGVV